MYAKTNGNGASHKQSGSSEKLSEASKKLIDLEQLMANKPYDVATLRQYDEAYKEYLAAGRPAPRRGLIRLLKDHFGFHHADTGRQ